MDKLLLFLVITTYSVLLHMAQLEEQTAVQRLFELKRAVNQSAHAASLMIDEQKLAAGIRSIDPREASMAAEQMLGLNLHLDKQNQPTSRSPVQTEPRWLVFEVINEQTHFPYTYRNDEFQFEVTLTQPGVVMVVEFQNPGMFGWMEPVVWQVKGSSEWTMP